MFSLTKHDKVIGIVGGMGPEAGGMLFSRILSLSAASRDQDHLSVLLMSLPKYMVDRTSFLEGKEDNNPALNITKIILKLEEAGASIIGIPCNTTHVPAILDKVFELLELAGSKVMIINMPLETCRFISGNYPTYRRIGVMSSNGTYRSGLYKNLLEQQGYEVVLPDAVFQNDVIHNMVYDPLHGIKANPDNITRKAKLWWAEALNFFKAHHTDALILGCTEFSIISRKSPDAGIPIVDSMESLARSLIREALQHAGHAPYPSGLIQKSR